MWPIGPGEVSPVQANPHGMDESRSDYVDQRFRKFSRDGGSSLGYRCVPTTVRTQRKEIANTGGLDTGYGAHTGDDLLKNFSALAPAGVVGRSAVIIFDLDGGGAAGLEAEI